MKFSKLGVGAAISGGRSALRTGTGVWITAKSGSKLRFWEIIDQLVLDFGINLSCFVEIVEFEDVLI